MSEYQKDIDEINSLLKKLDDIYHEFEANNPTEKAAYANSKELVFLALARGFCNDPDMLKEIEALEQKKAAKKNQTINLSITPSELLTINLGLVYLYQSKLAEEYVKKSVATGTTNEQRWSKVAETMLIKNPGEKLSLHGYEELIWYSAMINCGKNTKQASEEVFKKFSFNSLEACDKWLRREIQKYQKTQPDHWFCDLPKPSTAPRTK
jgi:hypothetical protein